MKDTIIDITPDRPADHRRGLTGGLVMITLGLVFLGRSLGWPVPENWWALFILIPAVPGLVRAIALLGSGRGVEAFRAFGSSLVLVIVAAAFLLNLDWSRVWPAFLILAGVSMLLPKRAPESR